MKRNMLLGFVIVIAMAGIVFAQPATSWEQTYGGTLNDYGYCVQQTNDGGYIITGTTESFGNGEQAYLIKTDQDGNEEWSNQYGGGSYDQGHCVQQTPDGGYIIVGNTLSSDWDIYLVKTDPTGTVEWDTTYDGGADDVAYSIDNTEDGGYIIAGHTRSYGNGGYDVYLVKVDSSGSMLWHQSFGDTGDDYGRCVEQTDDEGYIIAGTCNGGSSSDFYLIKTDASGTEVWSETYGDPTMDECYSVQQTDDGGYILVGNNQYGVHDVYLVKTDGDGNEIWSQTYGGSSSDYGYCVQQTSDGGYIIAGETFSFGAGLFDVYLIKTDGSGNEFWSQTVGGTSDDLGYCVRQTPDDGYIIAGWTASYGAGGCDVYLIKLDGDIHPFNVELTYVSGSPIPPSGGNLYFDVLIEYLGTDPVDFDAWLDVSYMGGAPTQIVSRSFTDYQPSWAINRSNMWYPVPEEWPAGDYEMFCRVGLWPDVIWAEDSFPFEKSGTDYIPGFTPVPVDGAPNPFDEITSSQQLATSHLLVSAYPNPFNPNTNLIFSLETAERVKLSVYDIQGRLLTTLVDGYRDAGVHEVTFGASDLSSGIYFAQIEIGTRSSIQKLMLVK